jgi:hypothetical protein
MRTALLLFGASVCVAVIGASIALAPASGAEYPSGRRLDEPHAMRPIAAYSRPHPSNGSGNHLAEITAALDADRYQRALRQVELVSYLDSVTVPSPEEAQVIVETFRSNPTTRPTDPGTFLSCVRQRESGGDYSIHELTGASQAAGAYQFLPTTWNSIAGSTGRSDLVGVDPANASPADQDAMAQGLFAQQGAAPWGGGC